MTINGDESHEEEAVMSLLGDEPKGDPPEQSGRVTNVMFGVELTNSPSKRGRGAAAYGDGEVRRTSPRKLARK
jgi:hypothetical protein